MAILYRNSYGGHVVNFLASTVLAFSFDGMEQTKLIWWATFTALITYRLADSCYWTFVLDSRVHTRNAHKIKNKFFVLVVSTASLWALYPLLMFDSFSTHEFTCAAVIFAAMAGGSVSILSPHKLGAMLYSGLLLIPFSLISLLSDDNLLQLLGGLGIACAVVILVTAAKFSDFTSEAIALKNENSMLLEQMDQEKEAVKETNEQLKNTLTRLSESKSNLELQVRERTRQNRKAQQS